MGINFPSTPTEGQVLNISPGKSFVFRKGLWKPAPTTTALPKNYIVNPSMQISQQHGSNAVGTGAFVCDQWVMSTQTIAGSQAIRTVDSIGYVFAQSFSSVTATITASMLCQHMQLLEGSRLADLQWGTAAAKDAILRFRMQAAVPGTYSACILDSASAQSFVKAVVLPDTNWRTFSFVVPGPTVGTWPTGNVHWGSVRICSIVGSTYAGVEGWQSGAFVGVAGQTNIAAAINQNIIFTDVGLYADPYKTGVAPDFKVPNIGDEMRRCQRYWYRAYATRGWVYTAGIVNAMALKHPVTMRATPAAAVSGSPSVYDGLATSTATSIQANSSNAEVLELNYNVSPANQTAQRPCMQYITAEANYIAVSARM